MSKLLSVFGLDYSEVEEKKSGEVIDNNNPEFKVRKYPDISRPSHNPQ